MSTIKKNIDSGKNRKVANRLRKLAKERFRSQAELARALGVKPQTLTQYLNGKNLPGNTIQTKLRKLGVDVEFLMTGRHRSQSKLSPILVVDEKAAMDIAAILRVKFLVDREYDLISVAEQMKIPSDRFREIVSGAKPLLLSTLAKLTSTTGDLEFVKPLFVDTDVEVSLKPLESESVVETPNKD